MIKKPEKPSLADYVRGDRSIIDQKWQAVRLYKTSVVNRIAAEFNTSDPEELVVILAEKYHKPFKINQTRGPKIKWTPALEIKITALIELRHQESPKRSIDKDIEWLLEEPVLKQFAMSHIQTGSTNTGHEAIKAIHKRNKSNPLCKKEIGLYNKDPDFWMKSLLDLIMPVIKISKK